MKLNVELRASIDAMNHADLLQKIRFAPIGAPIMQGESGDYLLKRRGQLRDEDPRGAVADSKRIGW